MPFLVCSTAYYELSLDSGEKEKQKSSGLVVYTGSGSSAWVYNIHRLLPYQVKKVLRLGKLASSVVSSDVQQLLTWCTLVPRVAAHNSKMETSNFNQLVDRGRAIAVCSSHGGVRIVIYHLLLFGVYPHSSCTI